MGGLLYLFFQLGQYSCLQKDYDSSRLLFGDVLLNLSCAAHHCPNKHQSLGDRSIQEKCGHTHWPYNDLCLVSASAVYITYQGIERRSFLLQDQAPLTLERFVKMTRDKLTAAGIDANHYSGQ